MGGVGENRVNRQIDGELVAISVEDQPPLGGNWLPNHIFLGSDAGIFFVLADMQVDESGGEDGEDQRACTASDGDSHLLRFPHWADSVLKAVRRTPSAVAVAGGVRRAILSPEIATTLMNF